MLRALYIAPVLLALAVTALVTRGALAQGDADEQLMLRLQNTIVDVEYVAVDFDEIIADLRQKYDLNIHVSWNHLESRGIRRDTRLEVRLKQVLLSTVLTNVLREVDPSGSLDLQFTIEGGVIVITTGDAVTRQRLLRAYDITDFLGSGYAERRFFSTPVLSLELTGREAIGGENVRAGLEESTDAQRPGGGSGGGGGGFGGGGSGGNIFDEGDGLVSDMELVEELIDILVTSVTPDSWEDNGGIEAYARYHDNRLFNQHTIAGHQKVQGFLEALRAGRPVPMDAEAMVIRIRSDRAREWRASIGESFPRLSAEEFDRLAQEQPREDVLFHGTTTGHNGRRVWFSALTQRDIVIDATPLAGQNINAFSPETGFVTEGLELIALPLMSPNGAELRLDVEMAWIPAAHVTAREVRLAPGEATTTIDQVQRSMRTVSTQTTVATGEAIALTIPAQVAAGGVAPEWEDYLVLRIRPASH